MTNEYIIPEGLENAASIDAAQYTLNSVYWNAGFHEWAATDGKMLAVIAEPSRESPSVIIPLEAVKRHRKTGCPIVLSDNGKELTCAGERFCKPGECYVNYKALVDERFLKDYEQGQSITVDFELLAKLASSIQSEGKGRNKVRMITLTLSGKLPKASPLLIRATKVLEATEQKRRAVESGHMCLLAPVP